MAIQTIQNIKDRLFQLFGDLVLIKEDTYINTANKAVFIDKEYGEWIANVSKVLRGSNHPSRARKIASQKIHAHHSDPINRKIMSDLIKSDQIQNKIKNTCLEKYGVINPLMTQEVKEKSRKTCLEKYGVDHYTKTQEFKETIAEQYDSIQEKTKVTNQAKYGVDYHTSLPETQDKITKTCLEKYGYKRASGHQDIQQKMKDTCLEKYGLDTYTKTQEFRKFKSCKNRGIDIKDFTGFITNKEERKRLHFRSLKLHSQCYKKANDLCDCCGKKRNGKNSFNAHHLNSWSWAIDQQFDLSNLVALCKECHILFHRKYTKKNNTKEQYEEFKKGFIKDISNGI